MDTDPRQARHHLRGRLNALKLCVTALEMLQTPAEALEFLTMIEQAADRIVVALDAFEAVQDRNSSTTG